MRIRTAKETDVYAIAAILRELGWFPYMTEESPAETESRVARSLQMCRIDDSHTVLVAEDGAQSVVGYVSVHWLPYLMLKNSEGFISELFVRESERGKGIGRSLLDAVKKRAVERGCTRLHLVTGKGRTAYEIYPKLGWKERAEIADFIFPLP